jgi:serine/threonine protein kinase
MGAPPPQSTGPRAVGRYAVFGEIASGGMATVHLGRLIGAGGFSRTVAVKCLFPQFVRDPEFVAMLLDEARLAARVRHPNVVPTLDVVSTDEELFVVMEYVQGDSLARLLREAKRRKERIPPGIVSAIVAGALHGLHAAHEATSEQGEPLHLVHRDVSPQNILVGADGVARVLDFGADKAVGRLHTTRDGRVKGKLAYMAPEQLQGAPIDRQADVFATAVVLWEALTSARLFEGETEALTIAKILEQPIVPPSRFAEGTNAALDEVALCGLRRDSKLRYGSAEEMALALERAERPALPSEVGAWVRGMIGDVLEQRARAVAEIESGSATATPHAPSVPPDPTTAVLPSQVSSISVSRRIGNAFPNAKPGRTPFIVAFAALVVAAAAIGTTIRRPRSMQGAAAPMATTTASAHDTAAPAPSGATPAVSASATLGATPSPSPVPRPSPPRQGPKPSSQPAQHGARSNCYTVDDQGIWHIRPSCL